jgi:hypothetical protein
MYQRVPGSHRAQLPLISVRMDGDSPARTTSALGHSRRFAMQPKCPISEQFRTCRSSVEGCARPVIQGSKLSPDLYWSRNELMNPRPITSDPMSCKTTIPRCSELNGRAAHLHMAIGMKEVSIRQVPMRPMCFLQYPRPACCDLALVMPARSSDSSPP